MPIEFPLSQQSKGSIESARFAELHARQFKGGLPVFTATREITISKPSQGEIWAEFLAGSIVVYVYYNGSKYPATPL